jgi:hypothetical protein
MMGWMLFILEIGFILCSEAMGAVVAVPKFYFDITFTERWKTRIKHYLLQEDAKAEEEKYRKIEEQRKQRPPQEYEGLHFRGEKKK